MKSSNLHGRNIQIEGLRGFSILIIVFFHLIYRYFTLYLPDISLGLIGKMMSRWGNLGVFIFLFISVWFLSLNSNKDEKIIKLIIKKLLRLWPAYVVCVTITYIITLFLDLPGRTVDFKTYLLNLTMLEGFMPNVKYVDSAHWYLTTLVSITFCIIIIERLINESKRRLAYPCWIVLCTVIHYMPTPIEGLGVFFAQAYVGAVVYIIMIKKIVCRKDKTINFKRNYIEYITIVMSLVYMSVIQDFVYLLIMILGTLIFLLCYNDKIRVLENKFFVFIGEISYPLYLIHQNISYMVLNLLIKLYGVKYYLFYFIVAFGISFILAYIIYYIVERPMQKIIKRLLKNSK